MTTLYLVGGTMGIGKTAACQILKKQIPKSVFLDGDWCWDMYPFQVTERTKSMVMDNICFLLNQFMDCGAFDNIIFCWVMHQQEIMDEILNRLDLRDTEVRAVSLLCNVEVLASRLQKDVDMGVREPDVIGRSIARLGQYACLNTVKIDVSGLTPAQTAEAIRNAPPVRWIRRERMTDVSQNGGEERK